MKDLLKFFFWNTLQENASIYTYTYKYPYIYAHVNVYHKEVQVS